MHEEIQETFGSRPADRERFNAPRHNAAWGRIRAGAIRRFHPANAGFRVRLARRRQQLMGTARRAFRPQRDFES
jgi:hypothetical protein